MFRFRLWLLWIAALSALDAAAFDQPLRPFLENHCYDCHDDTVKKGGVDLTALTGDLAKPAVMAEWTRVFDQLAAGNMPPKDKPQPAAQERAQFGAQLSQALTSAHAAQKGAVLRRLNRQEYENTLNDLFGVNLRLGRLLPEDGRSHEFDTVGSALSLSMVQMQRYLDAAGLVLDAAIAKYPTAPEPTRLVASYGKTQGGEQFFGKNWLKLDDETVVFFKRFGYPSGMLREANFRKPGYYNIRVTGYGYQTDQPVTAYIGGTTFARGAEMPTFGYFAFPPSQPTTIEFTTWVEANYMVQIEPEGITDRNYELRNGVTNYKGPGLAIQRVEVEGPLLDQYPSQGHQLLFADLARTEIPPRNPRDKERSWYVPKFEIASAAPAQDARRALTRVAAKAFRRPVVDAEIQPYLDLFETEMSGGATFEDAYRTAVTGLLCAPDFLYLREKPGKLDDYALASRLAYFLTRTAPDDALLAAAASGKLASDPAVLRRETDRLLADPRSDRFIKDFTDAWLDLRSIEFTSPDAQLYPEFDPYLQNSMLKETRAYLRELIAQNLPASNVVKSDFAMLNERLAEHYGVAGVKGPELRRVSLPAESPRGGFLSQGSILKVSANGTNTSPVVRGVWVTERILGITPSPPPPGIPGVEPDIRGATTLRELLDKHRSAENCRACHALIDPPGFALENFNPIGGWQERFRGLDPKGEAPQIEVKGVRVRYRLGPMVDASGELPDGRGFANYVAFRDLLAAQPDVLAKTLLKKLLTFGAGREMGFSDREEIGAMVKASAAKGYRVRDLIHLAIASEIFRSK